MNREQSKELRNKLENLVDTVRKETLAEVLETMWQEYNKIDTILDNGTEILAQSYGERFMKMYDKRRSIRSKAYMLLRLINKVNDMR